MPSGFVPSPHSSGHNSISTCATRGWIRSSRVHCCADDGIRMKAVKRPAAAGYSRTPLAKKLGFKPSSCIVTINAPEDYPGLVEPLPADVAFEDKVSPRTDIVHVFVTRREDLAGQLRFLRRKLKPE